MYTHLQKKPHKNILYGFSCTSMILRKITLLSS